MPAVLRLTASAVAQTGMHGVQFTMLLPAIPPGGVMYKPIPNTGLTSMARGLGCLTFMHNLLLEGLQEELTTGRNIRLASLSHVQRNGTYDKKMVSTLFCNNVTIHAK